MHFRRPFGQRLNHILLHFRRLGHHVVIHRLRGGQVQLVGGLDVRRLPEHGHQLRKVEEPGKARACAVARPLRGQLNGRDRFPKGGGPAIEVGKASGGEQVVLEIAHHGIQLRHGVGHGSTRGKHDAAAAGQLVHIAALEIHVAGLLRVRGGETRHVAHLRVQKKILVVMRLVHIQPVHAELFEGDDIVLARGGSELLQPGFQLPFHALQLLDGEPLGMGCSELLNALFDLVDLLLKQTLLTLLADGNFLKLRVTDNNGVIVAGGDAGAELLAVFGFKVLFGGDQQVGRGIEAQELRGPLLGQVIGHGEEGLAAEAQPFGFHAGGHHLERLTCPHLVGQQAVAAVKDVGDGVPLMPA